MNVINTILCPSPVKVICLVKGISVWMNVQQGLTHFGANLTHFEVRSHSSEAADLDRSGSLAHKSVKEVGFTSPNQLTYLLEGSTHWG